MSVELAITLDQPYPALIVAGVKDWETRPSPPNGPMRPDGVRGLPGCAVHPGERIAIHASVRKRSIDETGEAAWQPLLEPGTWRLREPLALGAVVATAVVAEALPILPEADDYSDGRACIESYADRLRLWAEDADTWTDLSDQLPFGGWRPGRWAWRLTDVRPVDPIPCRGAQGVWRLPRRVQEALCDA